MRWIFLTTALVVPLVCLLLFKIQDPSDFIFINYEKIGQGPAFAFRKCGLGYWRFDWYR